MRYVLALNTPILYAVWTICLPKAYAPFLAQINVVTVYMVALECRNSHVMKIDVLGKRVSQRATSLIEH